MQYYIKEQNELNELAVRFESESVVAVDTEFLRESTYNAKLCLVQLGIGKNQYCIDVLALEDMQCLTDFFANPKILKLFHAARQDMEVIYQMFGVLPQPIFDTQLAAALNGMDMQVGHTKLVETVLGVELASSQARTDWSRRPLSDAQLHYAAEDVTYLVELYKHLKQGLEKKGKWAWYEEETAAFYQLDKYVIDPQTAYKRLNGGALRAKQQHCLKLLANWREQMAQDRDIPRTWVVKDNGLFDIAANSPTSMQRLASLDVLGKRSLPKFGPQIIDIVLNVPDNVESIWQRFEPLTKQEKAHCSVMMQMTRKAAEQHEIAQGLLATRKDMESFWRKKTSDKLLTGWRKSVLGQQLLAYIEENQN